MSKPVFIKLTRWVSLRNPRLIDPVHGKPVWVNPAHINCMVPLIGVVNEYTLSGILLHPRPEDAPRENYTSLDLTNSSKDYNNLDVQESVEEILKLINEAYYV